MNQIIPQTDEEKMAMYMKLPKEKIIEMLIQCNKFIDSLTPQITSSKGEDKKEKLVLCGFCKTPIHVDAYGGEKKGIGSFHANCLIA